MALRMSLVVLCSSMLVGCGPSQSDYDKTRKHAEELESEVATLHQQVERLESELEDLKNGPAQLLAQGKAATDDHEIVAVFKKLQERHPNSEEAKLAGPLLRAAEGRINDAEMAVRKAAALKDVCRIEGKRIAPHFKGTDIQKVIKAFNKSKLKAKGEFESTAEYEKRVKNELSAIADPRQCIVIDPHAEYDADGKRWKLRLYTRRKYGYAGLNREMQELYEIVLDSRSESRGSYTGSNAFGVSRNIDRRAEFQHSIHLLEQSFNRAMASSGALDDSVYKTIFIPMATEQAKGVAAGSFKLLVEYEWTPGFVDQDVDHHTPTIDEPFDSETTTTYVLGKATRVLVINDDTGDVLLPK